MSNHLTWSDQVNMVFDNANRALGIIKRMGGTSNMNVFSQLYESLVRPILEYAVPVWSPYLVKEVKEGRCHYSFLLELQKRGTVYQVMLWRLIGFHFLKVY